MQGTFDLTIRKHEQYQRGYLEPPSQAWTLDAEIDPRLMDFSLTNPGCFETEQLGQDCQTLAGN